VSRTTARARRPKRVFESCRAPRVYGKRVLFRHNIFTRPEPVRTVRKPRTTSWRTVEKNEREYEKRKKSRPIFSITVFRRFENVDSPREIVFDACPVRYWIHKTRLSKTNGKIYVFEIRDSGASCFGRTRTKKKPRRRLRAMMWPKASCTRRNIKTDRWRSWRWESIVRGRTLSARVYCSLYVIIKSESVFTSEKGYVRLRGAPLAAADVSSIRFRTRDFHYGTPYHACRGGPGIRSKSRGDRL